jgi:hypothetical protein
MLEARKTSIWRNSYDISLDGRPLARWDGSSWKLGGAFDLDGRRYQVRSNTWGTTYVMADDADTNVATADRVGRKNWTVQAAGVNYVFRRPSIWRHEEELVSEGRRVGSVSRKSMWRSDTVADLPGLPVPVQVFVLAVVVTVWDSASAAAS